MATSELRKNEMMAHLLDALERGQDIGHYGRLVFAMIARHFMPERDLVKLLTKDPNVSEEQARALLAQVSARDYNPPRPNKIQQWQAEQKFPICPSDDPDACNVYKNLSFPDGVYEHINDYYHQKAQ